MKYFGQKDFELKKSLARFVFLQAPEGGRVSDSLREYVTQKYTGENEAPELDLIEQNIIRTLPTEAEKLLRLSQTFSSVDQIKTARNTERVQAAVKEAVFNTLSQSSTDANYQKLVDDVQKDLKRAKGEAELSLKTTEQGVKAINALNEQYQRTKTHLNEEVSDVAETQGWFSRWLGSSDPETETAIFEAFNEEAQNVISDLTQKFAAKKEHAETKQKENKTIIDRAHKLLSPELKAHLVTVLRYEAQNPSFDLLKAGTTDPAVKNALMGTERVHRIAVYEADYNRDRLAQKVQTLKSRRASMAEKAPTKPDFLNPSVFQKNELDKIRNVTGKFDVDGEFNESQVGTLCDALEEQMEAQDRSRKTVYQNYSGPMSDYERLAAFIAYLSTPTNQQALILLPPVLKRQLNAALDWMQDIGQPDKEAGYSKEFLQAKNTLLNCIEGVSSSVEKLPGVAQPSTDALTLITELNRKTDVKKAKSKMFEISTFIAEASLVEDAVKRAINDLDSHEASELEEYVKKLRLTIDKLSELLAEWQRQYSEYKKIGQGYEKAVDDFNSDLAKINKKKEPFDVQRTALVNKINVLNGSDITDVNTIAHWNNLLSTLTPSTKAAPNQAYDDALAEKKAKVNELKKLRKDFDAANKSYKEARNDKMAIKADIDALENSSNGKIKKWESDKKTLESFEFTNSTMFLNEASIAINSAAAQLKDKKYQEKSNVDHEQVAQYFKTQAQIKNAEAKKVDIEALQADQFMALTQMVEGQFVSLGYVSGIRDKADLEKNELKPNGIITDAILVDKTDSGDAVILYDKHQKEVICVENRDGKYNVVCLPANEYDGNGNIPPEIFEQSSGKFGDLIDLEINFVS